MSKSKKMTFGMIWAAMRPGEQDVTEYDFEGANGKQTITIKRSLTLGEAMSFIDGIAGACVDMDTGTYNPGVFDFALRLSALIYYAGFSTPDMTNIEAVAKAWDVVYQTRLFDAVIEHINYTQYHELVEAAAAKISYMKDCLVSTQASKMNELIGKMDEVMQSGQSVMEQLSSEDMRKLLGELGGLVDVNAGQRPEASADDDGNVIRLHFGEDK